MMQRTALKACINASTYASMMHQCVDEQRRRDWVGVANRPREAGAIGVWRTSPFSIGVWRTSPFSYTRQPLITMRSVKLVAISVRNTLLPSPKKGTASSSSPY
jgi:hypothetical protein